jgi:hypothetical protein
MAVVVEAFDGRLFNRAVHPFDLAIGPRMVWLRQAVFNPIGFANHVKAHCPRIDGIAVPQLLGELEAVVRENGIDLIGHGFEHVLQELPSSAPASFFYELGHSELGGAVNADN